MIGYDSEHARLDAISKSVSIFPSSLMCPVWWPIDPVSGSWSILWNGAYLSTLGRYLSIRSMMIYLSIHSSFLGEGKCMLQLVGSLGLYDANLESIIGRKQVEAKVSIYIPGAWNTHLYIYTQYTYRWSFQLDDSKWPLLGKWLFEQTYPFKTACLGY